ncbi:hypothetical protein FE62_15300 [Staphylococcus aureus]|nr:hypothetical protein FE62_15300 [Staphylococcus aureus]
MYGAFDSCARSVKIRIDMQDGSEITTGWNTPRLEREDGRIMARLTGSCGKEGRFWEAKP